MSNDNCKSETIAGIFFAIMMSLIVYWIMTDFYEQEEKKDYYMRSKMENVDISTVPSIDTSEYKEWEDWQ